jgi:arabinose operon protein AraL
MRRIDGFVFDLDGTVYLGEQALPGAVECIAHLRQQGKAVVFISNKPLTPGRVYAEKLTRLGIPTSADEVITSAFVLGKHLQHAHPSFNYYVVGEEALKTELRGYGLRIMEEKDQDPRQVIDPSGIDAVIVAFDRSLDYRKLNTAFQALMNGAQFFATNADKACPMPEGAIPDAGATIAYLEHITGRKLELLGGKPSSLMMQAAAEALGLPPENCMLVGDRLETDIFMGQQAGFSTAVVLTGVTQRTDVSSLDIPLDLVLENLGELIPRLSWLEGSNTA